MGNLAENIPRDHAPNELSPEEQAAVEAIVARGGSLLSPFAADPISAHGSVDRRSRAHVPPAIDNSLRAALAGEWESSSEAQPASDVELDEAIRALPEPRQLAFMLTVIDGALAYHERALHDSRELDAFLKAAKAAEAAGFRPKSIRHAASRSPHHRSAREPRRRASRSATAATRAGPSDGDGPPPEEPPKRRASQKGPSSLGRRRQRIESAPAMKPEPRSDWRGRALRLIGGGR